MERLNTPGKVTSCIFHTPACVYNTLQGTPHTGHQFLCVLEWFAFTLVVEKTSKKQSGSPSNLPRLSDHQTLFPVYRHLRWLPAILPDSLFTVRVFKICLAATRIVCDGISWTLLRGSARRVYLLVLTALNCTETE